MDNPHVAVTLNYTLLCLYLLNSRKKLVVAAEQRTQTIDEYIKNNMERCKTGAQNAFENDKIEAVTTYALPRNLLRLNPNNGRFKAEMDIVQQERKNDGKSIELNPDDPEDSKTIQRMIKGEYPHSPDRKRTYNYLKDNIYEIAQKTGTNGQEVAGLITNDGILVNGNRRWVVMEELAEASKKKGEPLKYDKIKVGRLKKGVSKYDLWKNEAKEQISQESREEYDYVNSALEIKRGYQLLIDQDMSERKAKIEIAKTLFGRTEKDVGGYLAFLDIADLFLEEINKKDQYTYIQESGNEKGIVTILQDVAKERQKRIKAGNGIAELHTWLNAVFAFCRFSKEKPTVHLTDGTLKKLSFGHREYRQFQKKIIEQPEIYKNFIKNPILQNIDVAKPKPSDASEFYQAMRESQEEYDIKMDINTPIGLIKKAKNALRKASQDLAGTRKSPMIEQIKKESGLDYMREILELIKDINTKVNSTKPPK